MTVVKFCKLHVFESSEFPEEISSVLLCSFSCIQSPKKKTLTVAEKNLKQVKEKRMCISFISFLRFPFVLFQCFSF